MRGDTAAEKEVGDHGESAAAAAAAAAHSSVSGERRPSIVALENMLRKVSQSPFHSQYKTLSSTSSGSSAIESQNKQDDSLRDLDGYQLHSAQNGLKMEDNCFVTAVAQNGVQELFHSSPQNGVNGDLARTNPFYNHYQESGSKGHAMEAAGWKTSEVTYDTLFAPPPEFQSSPLDLQPEIKTVEDGARFSEPQKDLFQALTHSRTRGSFQTSTLAQDASANGHFHDVTLNSPNVLKPVPAQAQNISRKSFDLFNKEEAVIQAAGGEDLFRTELSSEVNLRAESPSVLFDPFKSPSNMEDDLFRSPRPVVTNPFYPAMTKGADLFQTVPNKSAELFHIKENKPDHSMKEDLFGTSSKGNVDVFSPVDPFPSPITRDLFKDFSSSDDPFGTSKQKDPFQDVSNGTPDIFQPLSAKADRRDIFQITPSNATSKPAYSTPLFSGLPETRVDMRSSPDLFTTTQPASHPDVLPKSSDGPRDVVLTTPKGTTHDILQMTPFTQARNLSVSPSTSPEMTHVVTFKRPPKPLPRTRPPRKDKPPLPDKPPKPEKPPTPVNDVQPQPTVPKVPPKPAPRPPPKPVVPHKPKTPENKPNNPESYVVFEDILLIGQERCVEDWPEDSPELNPDFKPSGTLRLRRESLNTKADSDGGSGEDQDGAGTHSKKKDRKFRLSRFTRRESVEKCDDTKEGKSRTLSSARKSSKEYLPDVQMAAGQTEDWEQNGTDHKKKHLKSRVSKLLRRASTTSSMLEEKHTNGHLPQGLKQDDDLNKASGKQPSIRRWSEGTVIDGTSGEEEEEEEGGDAQHEQKRKKKMKIKFVPHRGFAITVEKHHLQTEDKLKGAHGYTPRKGSKDKSQDDMLGPHGYTPRKKSQDDAHEGVEQIQGHSLQSTSKAAFMDDEHIQHEKTLHMTAGLYGDEDLCGMEDCKPKKTTKMKLLHMVRRSSKEDMLDDSGLQKKKSSFSAEELDLRELNGMEDCKPKNSKYKGPIGRKPQAANGHSEPFGFKQASCGDFPEDDISQAGKDGEMYDSEQDEVESCKPRKPLKHKGFRKHKAKSKAMDLEWEDPPGATCSDYLSEAAKAEWLAAQMDERAAAGLEDDSEEGDTDSLMEWWCTVEQWDEVPSDDEDKIIKEDESKSFTVLADKVHRGLRVFNKVFTERAEVLWQSILMLHAIADDISNFHHKAKIAGITGGTTTAVGGVTAIAGLALAPFTFGASLLVTAVGVGVATAGGIASASAAISDNVNNMHERKKVETVLQGYEAHLLDIGKILHFLNQGLYKLRGHPFLRSGTQHYAQDWEIRRAVQMISLVDSPVMRATEITDAAVTSVQGLFRGMDKYFMKDSRELRKGCKKEVVAQIRDVANVLNDGIVELNAIREEVQDATGSI